MIKPFVSDNLFEINYNAEIAYDNIGNVIYIDNIFKNYDEIIDNIYNVNVESWKKSSNSRNFIDYYDCRLYYMNHNSLSKDVNYFYNIMQRYFNLENQDLSFERSYTFNYFKNNIKGLKNNFQHYPHHDHAFNIIFYLDTVCDGGTIIYENQTNWVNKEADNLFCDIKDLKIEYIIKSKPNRAVIFNGNRLHGGYIENHDVYYYNWRINMVNFVEAVNK